MPDILVVCTGNVCRSPMARALLADRLRRAAPDGGWRVASAGTWAREGDEASADGQAAMARRGLDISDHRAQSVTAPLLEGVDLVLVMTGGHREALAAEFPDLADRIYLLSEMAGKNYDVQDPFGGVSSDYERTAAELESLIEEGLERIMALAGEASRPAG